MVQNYHTEFLTATIFNWNHLLKDDIHNQVVVNSFQWLVKEKKCIINAFVIMPNHFHLIWKVSDGLERKNVQGALFSFTAHEFKKELKKSNAELLEDHFVNKTDRGFQFWEREPMIRVANLQKVWILRVANLQKVGNPCTLFKFLLVLRICH